MRVLVDFVVLVVLPCASAVGRELIGGQATAGTELALEPNDGGARARPMHMHRLNGPNLHRV